MRILVAVEPVDGRKGIDSLAQLCRQKLAEDPFSGTVFLFLNKRRTIMRALVYDGSGFWLCQKRLSQGSFKWWPKSESSRLQLEAHQVQTLFANGVPSPGAVHRGADCRRSRRENFWLDKLPLSA